MSQNKLGYAAVINKPSNLSHLEQQRFASCSQCISNVGQLEALLRDP